VPKNLSLLNGEVGVKKDAHINFQKKELKARALP